MRTVLACFIQQDGLKNEGWNLTFQAIPASKSRLFFFEKPLHCFVCFPPNKSTYSMRLDEIVGAALHNNEHSPYFEESGVAINILSVELSVKSLSIILEFPLSISLAKSLQVPNFGNSGIIECNLSLSFHSNIFLVY